MKSTKEIELEINEVYEKLNSLRKAVNTAVDQIGGVCHSLKYYQLEEKDSSVVDSSAKELFEAADSIWFLADDDVPYIASLLREHYEYDQEYCGACDEPFVVSVGDDERQISHKRC